MKLHNKLKFTQKLKAEPEIQDKIRVRHIELVDDDDNVVASIGTKDGVYDKDKKPIFQIFNELQQVEVEISDKGITIHQHDNKKSITILNQRGDGTSISVDRISIFNKESGNIINLYAFLPEVIGILEIKGEFYLSGIEDDTTLRLIASSGNGIFDVADNKEDHIVSLRVNCEDETIKFATQRLSTNEKLCNGDTDDTDKILFDGYVDNSTEGAEQQRCLAIYQDSLYAALVDVTTDVETVEELGQLSEEFKERMVELAKQKSVEAIERDLELVQSDFGQAFLHVLRNPSPREDDIDLEYLDLD